MGALIGHVLLGSAFLLIGLWHMLNTIRSYIASPSTFESKAWHTVPLPAPSSRHFHLCAKLKHAELYLIIVAPTISIVSELFIWPRKHQPLADDFSIPFEHLKGFEHSTISLFFIIYASIALIASKRHVDLPRGLLHLLAALAFSQELLIFHLHSTDHMGLEGHYHWLLQLLIATCFMSTLLELATPTFFLLVLVRSAATFFQGLWLVHIGFVLWLPTFMSKNCRMVTHNGHDVVTCNNERSEMRAKALANLQFSWYLAAIIVFTLGLCFLMSRSSDLNSRIPYTSLDESQEKRQLVQNDLRSDHEKLEAQPLDALDLAR